MKRLRFYLPMFMLLLLTTPALQSCLNDWDDKAEQSQLAIGTVKILSGQDYYFALDDGKKMYPSDTTYVHNYKIVEGQRAFISIIPLDEKLTGYDYNVKVMKIENILMKDIISLTEATADSIGDDRINAIHLWITGDYLNIEYQFYHSNNPDKKHMLNLVINETNTETDNDADYLDLEFRHNDFDDDAGILGWGVVSFKLDNIASQIEGKKGLKIRVKSLYEGEQIKSIDFEKK